VTARWRVAAGVTATTTLAGWGWTHGTPVPNGATLLAGAVLAAVLWLTRLLTRAVHRYRDREQASVRARLARMHGVDPESHRMDSA
jgi:hypothetical protein